MLSHLVMFKSLTNETKKNYKIQTVKEIKRVVQYRITENGIEKEEERRTSSTRRHLG